MRQTLCAFCCFFVLIFSAQAAAGDSLSGAQKAAQKQAATPAGQAFQKKLHALVTPHVLGFMMKKCSMTTGIKPMNFDVVADISRFRTLQNYRETPSNKLTECLGARLTGVCFPWIPASYKSHGYGYPIELHVKAAYSDGIVIKKGQRLRLNGTCPGF